MKNSLFFLLILTIIFDLTGQDYSKLNLDEVIETVISFEVDETKKSSSDRRNGRKKVSVQIIPWKVALFYMTTYSYLFDYDDKIKKLTRNRFRKQENDYSELFNDNDLEYMTEQIQSENKTVWNLKFKKGKLRKNPGNKYYAYSIPIFDLSNEKAILYKEFTCGSLCAYGSIEIYLEKNGKWALHKTILIWVS